MFLRGQNNIFSGVIPNGIVQLRDLRELYLQKNSFYSDLPQGIGLVEDLEDLRVGENEMFGRIPASLYSLQKLKKLWLQDTLKCESLDSSWVCKEDSDFGFEGSIQTEIGNLKQLSQLLVNDNPLTGTLPTELGLCENLCKFASAQHVLPHSPAHEVSSAWFIHETAVLRIHKTDITGTVPVEVCELREKKLYSEVGGVFYADCSPNTVSITGCDPTTGLCKEDPFIVCDCCTDCCDHTTEVCIALDQ